MKEEEILNLKKQIDQAKQLRSELIGQQTAIQGQLEKKWKCKTKDEAKTYLKLIKDKITEFDRQIEECSKSLEEYLNSFLTIEDGKVQNVR